MPGRMEFEFGMNSGSGANRIEESPLGIMVLGDFGGHREQPELADPTLLMNLPVRMVDTDNFDKLWEIFTPRLNLDIAGQSLVIEPRDIDDFHPDRLFMGQPLFAELRSLRKRLLNSDTAAQALEEVLASGSLAEGEPSAEAPPAPSESGDEMFSRLLGESPEGRHATEPAKGGFEQLLAHAVGPHIVNDPDPRTDSAVDAVDKAIADIMRSILHHPEFQQLEGDWQALRDLVYGTESGETIQIRVCSVSKKALAAGLPQSAEEMAGSPVYELLVGKFKRGADGDGYSVLGLQFNFGSDLHDISLLATLATLAETHDAVVIGSASSQILGVDALHQNSDHSQWPADEAPFWSQLRQSPVSARIGLALPRILGRLPYGNSGEEVDHFEFEELVQRSHDQFLWVTPTLACVRLIAENFAQNGWSMTLAANTDIGDLPSYSFTEDGESKMTPCAELLMPERTAEEILQRGLMPIVSFKNRDMARLLRFQAVSEPLRRLAGPWSG